MRIHIALTLALAMILGAVSPQAAVRAAEDGNYAATAEEPASEVEAEEEIPAETGATAEEAAPEPEETEEEESLPEIPEDAGYYSVMIIKEEKK